MAQFEALLDFSDAPAENGKVDNTNGRDPFDPFGPSPTVEAKAGLGGGDLLVDFSLDAEVCDCSRDRNKQLPGNAGNQTSTRVTIKMLSINSGTTLIFSRPNLADL